MSPKPVNDPVLLGSLSVSHVPVDTVGHLHELRPGPAWARWRVSLGRMAKGGRGE
ncbi:MAG: hypothetical protein ABSG53_25820 [Thermoguttaceae bacterium]